MNYKFYVDEKTQKRYVQISDGVFAEIIDSSGMNLTEACTDEYEIINRNAKKVNIDGVFNTTYNLKDSLFIPVGYEKFEFIVEHIRHGEDYDIVYFVSKNIIGKSNMKNMDAFLYDLFSKMPYEFVKKLRPIHHVITTRKGEIFEYSEKLSLLSLANIKRCDGHSGADDVQFDGLKTESERCKSFKGQTLYWWLRSPYLSSSTNFMLVGNYGGISNGAASYESGVVPCFSIKISNKKESQNIDNTNSQRKDS